MLGSKSPEPGPEFVEVGEGEEVLVGKLVGEEGEAMVKHEE